MPVELADDAAQRIDLDFAGSCGAAQLDVIDLFQPALSDAEARKLEQWIVANLCSRSADVVLRLVEPNPGPAGWRTRSEGRSRVGTTDEM